MADALGAWMRRARSAGASDGLVRMAEAMVAMGEAPERVVPIRLSRAGVLTVACAGAAEAQSFAARAEELRDALRRRVPEVPLRSIRPIVADHALGVGPPPAPRPRPPTPTDEEIARAGRIAEGVGDPRLRELIARAAAARLALDRRDPASDRGKRPRGADPG